MASITITPNPGAFPHEVRLAEWPGPALREVERVRDNPIRRAGALQLVEERALGR